MRLDNIKVFAFDFDGTLIDSYSCIPEIWIKIGKRLGICDDKLFAFLCEALKEEDQADSKEVFDRSQVALKALKKLGIVTKGNIKFINGIYWSLRIKNSRPTPCAHALLNYLKRKYVLISISGNDGIRSFKKLRIRASGMYDYFSDIFVAGEDVPSKVEGLEFILRKYDVKKNEVLFIDDKPRPINQATERGFLTVKVEFKGPLKLGWKDLCTSYIKVDTLCDLLYILIKQNK